MESQRERPTEDAGSGTSSADLKSELSSLSEQAREQAASAAASVKQQAKRVAEQQKASGAQQLSGMARAIGGAAGELDSNMPQAAEFIRDMAGRLDATASALRERSVDDLVERAGAFARRQPATFFAGAVLAGFALSRFLKSSAHQG